PHRRSPHRPCRFPYTTLSRSSWSIASIARGLPTAGVLAAVDAQDLAGHERRMLEIENRLGDIAGLAHAADRVELGERPVGRLGVDRKSTRLNSSHVSISYAVF